MRRSMLIFLFVASVAFARELVAVEVEEFWYRAHPSDVLKLKTRLHSTNAVEIVAIWQNPSGVLWERSLDKQEVLQVAALAREFEAVPGDKGTYQEPCLRVLMVRNSETKATVEIRVSDTDYAFASFHTPDSYDSKKRRFRAPGIANMVQQVMRGPGARKKEVPPISLPPVKR